MGGVACATFFAIVVALFALAPDAWRATATPAVIVASAVLALAAGFAVALLLELRHPCIADVREAEVIAGARVLVTIRPQRVIPERTRRRADRELPPLIRPVSESYQLLYTQLADGAFNLPLVAVVGDRPMVCAAVAANLAAAAARQPRGTLLVDTDRDARSGALVMQVPVAPGLADVLVNRLEWPAVVHTVQVGRDCTVDVLPSGAAAGAVPLDATLEAFRHELTRLGRRYEAVIVNMPAVQGVVPAAVAGVENVVLCTSVGATSVATLRALAEGVAAHGARVRGLVLWEMEEPALPLEPPPPRRAATRAAGTALSR